MSPGLSHMPPGCSMVTGLINVPIEAARVDRMERERKERLYISRKVEGTRIKECNSMYST